MQLLGRKRIYTNTKVVNSNNVVDVLKEAYDQHRLNAAEIQYLIDYEGGKQPLIREKKIRSDINIEVNDNLANYVTEFKLGYFWGTPAMLVQRGNKTTEGTKTDITGITALNEMLENGVHIGLKNQELAAFVEKCGIGHRLVDIKTDFDEDEDESFAEVYTLDPRYTFCVYHNGVGNKKVLSATYTMDSEGHPCFTCFTDEWRWEISNWEITGGTQINPLGKNPIVEYQRSVDRFGCFERQVSDMDGLNILVSDFANDTAQRTQEIWWGNDIDFPQDESGNVIKPQSGQWILTFTGASANGASKQPKIQPLSSTFQGDAVLNNMSYRWNRILQKCKVPMQHDSEGGGSTGTAMDMSSGWSAAEVDAAREELLIESGLREEIKLIIRAIRAVPDDVLPMDAPIRKVRSKDVSFHFNRKRNYDMAVKANAFATWVSHGINGRHALKAVDAFEDNEQVWQDSKEGVEQYQKSQFQETESEDRIMADSSDQIGNSPIIDGPTTSAGEE